MKKSVWLVALIGSLVVMLLAAAALVSQPALAGEAQLQSADSGGQFAAAPVVNDTVKYSVIPLGYLDGQQGGSSFGADVNLQGQVVGMSSGADRVNHGFIWHNGVMTDLGTLGDYPTVVAGVNDLGQVVGLSVNSNDEQRSFLWEAGQMQDLGTLSGFPILAHDINNNGQVVGSVNRSSANLNGVGFMWQDGSIEALAPGADDEAAAFAVNDEGQASGYLNYYNQLSDRRLVEPAVWDGGWSQLGNLAGSNPGFFAQGYAYAINDAGLVVGASQNSLGEMHAFLSEEGGMLDLGTLGGDFSLANDVNNLGQVVGFSRLADGRQHAFIAQDFDGDGQVGPGEMRDLNDLIPPEAQVEVIMAHGINDTGDIAATGIVDGQQQALLLKPVGLCEPTNLGGDENAGQDIIIDFIEVSQGIQSVDNEMPLVQFRQTMVRVHLFLDEDNPSPGVVVSGRLRAFQDGIELLGSPLAPVDGVGLAREDGGEREKLAHTLNFELPPTWLTDELLLCAEVNHKQKAAETNYENNVLETKVTFEPGEGLRVKFIPLHLYKDGDTSNPAKVYSLNEPDAQRIIAHLYRYHPVAGVRIWPAPTLFPVGYPIFDQQWDLSKKADGIRMLNRIALYNLLTKDEADNLIYSGMVHPDVDPGPFLGLARIGKTESWSTMSSSSGSHPTWHNEGGWVLAHEIGHNKGLRHVNCNNSEAGADPDYPWPHPNCQLADVDILGYYGLDVYHQPLGHTSPTVISNDPAAPKAHRAFPLMGYKRPAWVSPYETCKLLPVYGVPCNLTWSAPSAPLVLAPAAEPATADSQTLLNADSHIVASGFISLTAGTVELDEVYVLDNLPADALEQAAQELGNQSTLTSTEPFLLTQLDLSNTVLYTKEIPLNISDGEWVPFLEVTPLLTDTAKLQVRQGTSVLAERTPSANPPTVTLTSPNGGGTLQAGDTISWTAGDADGDELTFNLLYSPDHGVSWRVLALGLTGTTYELPSLEGIAGSAQARLRVMVADGWHTAQDDSDASLTIPGSDPLALLLAPADGALLNPFIGHTLHALATDDEDGPLFGGSLVWTSDVDGVLGTGEEVWADTLSYGQHTITLTVTDSDGRTASESVQVQVGQQLFLPAIIRP